MKQFKDIVIGILILLFIGGLIYFLVENDKKRNNRELARRILEISPRGGTPQTIEGLRQAIALYEDQIERNVREGAQTGAYWKILATRLSDRGMHRDALDALERAIHFNAEDAALFYQTGVSAGIVAKSTVGFHGDAEAERNVYYRLAENAYLRAIELESNYARPLYGLAVLYAFELDRPSDAIIYIERYLELRQNDIDALFVLARSHFMNRNFHAAIEIYERIIRQSRNADVQAQASENIDTIQRLMYE